jgi:hypothetical protein
MPETSGAIRRGVRLFGLGSGPLTRGSDRIQALARLLLLTAVLTSIPVAVTLSVATYGKVRQQETAAARGTRLATATLMLDAMVPRDRGATDEGAPQSLVTWATSTGGHRRALVTVPSGATAGSSVRIWIDPRGAVSTTPPETQDPAAQALGVGLLTVLGGPSVALAVYLLFCILLDRRRLREWASGWAVVEPVWSRKVR